MERSLPPCGKMTILVVSPLGNIDSLPGSIVRIKRDKWVDKCSYVDLERALINGWLLTMRMWYVEPPVLRVYMAAHEINTSLLNSQYSCISIYLIQHRFMFVFVAPGRKLEIYLTDVIVACESVYSDYYLKRVSRGNEDPPQPLPSSSKDSRNTTRNNCKSLRLRNIE